MNAAQTPSIVLVILDGAADRPYRELGGRTPLEAAHTPVLDSLAKEGQSGFFYPLGPGRIPSSELAHFRLLGYGEHPFPGRACLEAAGYGVPLAPGDVCTFLALRRVRGAEESYRVVGRYGDLPAGGGMEATGAWEDPQSGLQFESFPLPRGEAVVRIRRGAAAFAPCGDITDTDPFFFTDLPVMRPRPLANTPDVEAARETAQALERYLRHIQNRIDPELVPAEGAAGLLPVTKWTGTYRPLPAFSDLAGIPGFSVASTPLFRGLAALLGLGFREVGDTSPESAFTGGEGVLAKARADLAAKLGTAVECLRDAPGSFVHVHTKFADEAGHAGDAAQKAATLEALDAALEPLLHLDPDRHVLAVTSDHCTAVGGRTVHWGDSVPIVVTGPSVRRDDVDRFGERAAGRGSLGQIRSDDVLPFLLCQAEQAHFLGARPLPYAPHGIPARVPREERWR